MKIGTLKIFWERPLSKLLHIYFQNRRGMTLGVRAVVRNFNGEFLLVRHTYTPGWHFPGGGVEVGYSAEAALADELAQETGLCLAEFIQLHGIFFNSCVSERDHIVVYLCNATGELPQKPPSREIAEVKYFDLGCLPPNVDPGTIRRIQEIVLKKPISRYW